MTPLSNTRVTYTSPGEKRPKPHIKMRELSLEGNKQEMNKIFIRKKNNFLSLELRK